MKSKLNQIITRKIKSKIFIKQVNNMLKDKSLMQQWLEKYGIENYTVNDDFTVDVAGNVNLSHKELTEIEVQFNIVDGYFNCSFNKLSSLEGCPNVVGGFYCGHNRLSSLKYGPKVVDGDFYCHNNSLENLQNCPKKVGKDFNCRYNYLNNLEQGPQYVGRNFDCTGNTIIDIKNFTCHFQGNFFHESIIKNEFIPLLEDYYIMNKNNTYELNIDYNQLQNILLNHKLNENTPLKESSNKKNKL